MDQGDVEDELSNLCRLCGEDDICIDLFDEQAQEAELLPKIELSVRISISEDDGLPTGLCNSCYVKLLGYAAFYQQCHDTQQRLQEFLSIECALQKTSDPDHQENCEYVVQNESDSYLEDSKTGVVEVDDSTHIVESQESASDEGYTFGETDNTEENEAERLMSGPISIIVEDLQETQIPNIGRQRSDKQFSKENNKKIIYLVKNAGMMPMESVLSAVLANTESPSKNALDPSRKNMSRSTVKKRRKRRYSSDDQFSQKVFIKGSDGRENMILLDVPEPLSMVATEVEGNAESVDDPNWARSTTDHPPPRSHSWSKLKRARTAIRNSMKILRLPKPQNKRERNKERPIRKPVRKQKPITQEDPHYAVMMEKFAKPVSISTLKRHGLYKPKGNGYKIDAPYKKDVAPYIEKVSDTEFKCKICLTAKFRWNYKAEIHILEHLDWRPFECDVCGRAFTQNQYLTKHKRLHFPEDTNFMCEICGKGFQRRYYLTYHMDEHFDRTYVCEECGRKFNRRQKHDEHVRYHHKCHYSVCDICGHTLRTTALSRHRKQHGEKSFNKRKKDTTSPAISSQASWLTCNICGRAFRSLRERDDHEAEHSNPLLPFQCEECTVYFKTKRSFNNHILHVHTRIEGGECEVDVNEEQCEMDTREDECEIGTREEECGISPIKEECEEATRVLDELSTTIVVNIPNDI